MKLPLPTVAELAVFAAVALTCAALAAIGGVHDLMMAAFALPIFVVAAWMGGRRTGPWAVEGDEADVAASIDDAAE